LDLLPKVTKTLDVLKQSLVNIADLHDVVRSDRGKDRSWMERKLRSALVTRLFPKIDGLTPSGKGAFSIRCRKG
jgi:hypothetical protein